jgi:hypothetical protein
MFYPLTEVLESYRKLKIAYISITTLLTWFQYITGSNVWPIPIFYWLQWVTASSMWRFPICYWLKMLPNAVLYLFQYATGSNMIGVPLCYWLQCITDYSILLVPSYFWTNMLPVSASNWFQYVTSYKIPTGSKTVPMPIRHWMQHATGSNMLILKISHFGNLNTEMCSLQSM